MNILLVDDDANFLHSFRETLELMEPEAKVSLCKTYSDAIIEATNGTFDVAILDVMIPIMKHEQYDDTRFLNSMNTGIVLAKKLTTLYEQERIGALPRIYFLTARQDLSNEQLVGIEGYFKKPVRPSQIVKAIIS